MDAHSRRWGFVGAVAVVGALALGSEANAEPPQGRGNLCQQLSCTQDQEEELRGLIMDFRQDTKGDRDALKRLAKQAAKEFGKSKPNEQQLDNIRKQIAKHRTMIEKRVFQLLIEVHEELDASQREQLAKLIEKNGLRRLLAGGGRAKR